MNDEEKKNLMSETKTTQAEIDAHKPNKTIKFVSFLLTLVLIGAVVGPVTYIYLQNKAEDERIAEENRKIEEEQKRKEEKKEEEKDKEEDAFNPNLELELKDYTALGDFVTLTNGEEELETITVKDSETTFVINVTRPETDFEEIKVTMNDKEIYTGKTAMTGVRVFKYKEAYVLELGCMGTQLPNFDSYFFDKDGNQIGKIVNTSYRGFDREYTDEYILVKASNSFFDGECQSTKDETHNVEKTEMKYRLNDSSLTKYAVETKYCAS